MALEAVVFQEELFGCSMNKLCTIGEELSWPSCDFGGWLEEQEHNAPLALGHELGGGVTGGGDIGRVGDWNTTCSPLVQSFDDHWDVVNSSSPETTNKDGEALVSQEAVPVPAPPTGPRKRRRWTKSAKTKEEAKNQRMTHIVIERNRRKQMNEYLAVLRSLMPASYVPRGDQASIVGGAINFVKELEQLVQSLEAQKRIKQRLGAAPFSAAFFAFPHYSSSSNYQCTNTSADDDGHGNGDGEAVAENRSSVADIEVTMEESSHANLKVLSKRRPKQLLKLVVGLEALCLTTLHLNLTTIDEMTLCSFNIKVGEDCRLTTVDDIETAVRQMVRKIEEEAVLD